MDNHTMTVPRIPDPPAAVAKAPPLLELLAKAAGKRGASEPTIRLGVSWVRAFILFHGKRHPRELGMSAVRRRARRRATGTGRGTTSCFTASVIRAKGGRRGAEANWSSPNMCLVPLLAQR
jgi:hypothetical protein